MTQIIRQRQVVADDWRLLKTAADVVPQTLSDADKVIVPLGVWKAQRAALLATHCTLGVWLENHEDPAEVAPDLRYFGTIAVDFPQFTDGRGYSIARELRERHAWRGELRAIGDVRRDQLFYLARCGFDAFALHAGQDPHAALTAFDDFTEAYQTSVERPQPLFRRRAQPAAERAIRS